MTTGLTRGGVYNLNFREKGTFANPVVQCISFKVREIDLEQCLVTTTSASGRTTHTIELTFSFIATNAAVYFFYILSHISIK